MRGRSMTPAVLQEAARHGILNVTGMVLIAAEISQSGYGISVEAAQRFR